MSLLLRGKWGQRDQLAMEQNTDLLHNFKIIINIFEEMTYINFKICLKLHIKT